MFEKTIIFSSTDSSIENHHNLKSLFEELLQNEETNEFY